MEILYGRSDHTFAKYLLGTLNCKTEKTSREI